MAFFITLCASCENLCPRAVTTGLVKKSLRVAFALICPYTSVTPSRRRLGVDDDVDDVPSLPGRHHCPPSSRPAEPITTPPVPTIIQNVTHQHDE